MGLGDINLIAKIAPFNDGFIGMVDAKQVIGNGSSNVLLLSTLPSSIGATLLLNVTSDIQTQLNSKTTKCFVEVMG